MTKIRKNKFPAIKIFKLKRRWKKPAKHRIAVRQQPYLARLCLTSLIDGYLKFEPEIPFDKNFEELNKCRKHAIKRNVNMIKRRANAFHEHIRDENLKEIEIFIKTYQMAKIAYSTCNKCALSTALEFERAKIHTILRKNLFHQGADQARYNEYYTKLDQKTKEEIRLVNRDFFPKSPKTIISQLMLKTRVGFGTHPDFYYKLRSFYETLDKIEWIHPILRIVGSSEDTDIVFDFNNSAVHYLDATASENDSGLTYPLGYILIAARNTDSEVLGTIAHELTHYAVQLVYKNSFKPFLRQNDADRKKKYKIIVSEYEKDEHKGKCLIIDAVYDRKRYQLEQRDAELIVRVPHLLAFHNIEQDKLTQAYPDLVKLFDFFKTDILPDLRRESNLVEFRQGIKKINEKFHVFSTMEKRQSLSGLQRQSYCSRVSIKTPNPMLVLKCFVNKLEKKVKRINTNHIFCTLEQLHDKKNFNFLKKVAESIQKVTFFIIDEGNFNLDALHAEIFKYLKNTLLIFILKDCNLNFQKKFENVQVEFKWNVLHENNKLEIMKSKIIFPNLDVFLQEFLSSESESLQQSSIEFLREKQILNEMIKHFGDFDNSILQDLHILDSQIENANVNFQVFQKTRVANQGLSSPDVRQLSGICRNFFIKSPLPELVMENIVNELKKTDRMIDSMHIFMTLEQFLDSENSKMLIDAARSEVKPFFFIVELANRSLDAIQTNLLDALQDTIMFSISQNHVNEFHQAFQNVSEKRTVEVNLNWNALSNSYKSKIKKTKVSFQGSEVVFEDLFPNDSSLSLLQEAPLEEFFNPSAMKLQSCRKIFPMLPRVFIARTFQPTSENMETHGFINRTYVKRGRKLIISNPDSKKYDSESICDLLQNQKTVLISDSAGMGKSTSAAQLARALKIKNSWSWVIFIDLKQHTKVFLRDDQIPPESISPNFYSKNILKLESEFEQNLFANFYENVKVIFIIDGFDEISPKYKIFVMNILKGIQNSGNQLLIATRPHIAGELSRNLGISPIKLMPFTTKDQIEFLTKYWQLENSVDESNVKELLSKLQPKTNMRYFFFEKMDFFSTPIHIFMLAEVYCGKDLQNLTDTELDTFALYNRFFKKKLVIWNSKGPLAADENAFIHQNHFKLQEIFHKLALKQLFDDNELIGLKLINFSGEFIEEMIARVGIINYGLQGSEQFSHQTFAEYFVADFIIKAIFSDSPQISIMMLFVKILDNFTFDVVRKFMNDGLCSFDSEQSQNLVSEIFLKQFEEIAESGKYEKILNRTVEEKHARLLGFILQTLIRRVNVKIKFVRNVFFEALRDLNMLKAVWKCVEEFTIDIQKGFLFAEKRELNILWVIFFSGNENVLQYFLEVATNVLNKEEFLLFLSGEYWDCFPYFVTWFSSRAYELIRRAAESKLGPKDLEKLEAGKVELENRFLNKLADGLNSLLESTRNLLLENSLENAVETGSMLEDSLENADEAGQKN